MFRVSSRVSDFGLITVSEPSIDGCGDTFPNTSRATTVITVLSPTTPAIVPRPREIKKLGLTVKIRKKQDFLSRFVTRWLAVKIRGKKYTFKIRAGRDGRPRRDDHVDWRPDQVHSVPRHLHRVQGSGFRVQGSGFRVWGLGFGV